MPPKEQEFNYKAMSIIKQQISEILEEPGASKQILVGGILNCIPIVNLICLGFCQKNLEQQIHTDEPAEELDMTRDYAKLFASGFGAMLVGAGYSVVVAIPGSVSTISIMQIMANWKGSVNNELFEFSYTGAMISGLIGLAAFVAALIVAMHIPMALACFAESGEIMGGYSLKNVWNNMMNVGGEYYTLCALLATIPIVFMLGMLIPIAYLNQLPGFLWSFFVCWVVMRGTGKLYAERLKS